MECKGSKKYKSRKVKKYKAKTKIFSLSLFYFSTFLLFFTSLSFASDITFEATVDNNVVSLGESAQLSLTFRGATDVPVPSIQDPDGFSVRYLGPSTMMSIVNGKMSSSISHNYVLIPLKVGKFIIGPFSVDYNNQKYTSQEINIEVVDNHAQAKKPLSTVSSSQPQKQNTITEEQLKDRIFIELDVSKKDIYLNEIMPVTVRLCINKLAIKDIEYPLLSADGFSNTQFDKPNQYQQALSGLTYDVIEFKSQAYPLKSGELVLGPVQIKCNLIIRRQAQNRKTSSMPGDFLQDDDFFADFFTRYEAYPLDLKSNSHAIAVKPLPEENKPADFTGAVGNFDMQFESDSNNVKAGDPITLKIKISGEGNLSTVNAPSLESTKDFKIYQPQAKTEGNQKIFEQVIMPLSENVTQIPQLSFSFFNPEAGSYQTVKRGPIPITVLKPDSAQQSKIIESPSAQAGFAQTAIQAQEEILGKDIVYIKDRPGDIEKKGAVLYRSKFFMWVFILPLLLFIILFFVEQRNQRLRTDIRYARMRGALKKAHKGLVLAQNFLNMEKKDEFYGIIFKTLQDYIGDKLHVNSGGITALSAEQYLSQKGLSEEFLLKIREFFNACDAARFALAAITKDDMVKVLQLAKEIVEELEKARL